SAHALVASPYKSAYVAAKHGIAGLTKTVALEVAEQGITMNAICPGYVWTPLVEKQIPDTAKARGLTEAQVKSDVLLHAQPTKQFVQVSEVAALAAFLASREAASITGAIIPIDGALIAGNAPENRFDRLREFWAKMESNGTQFDLLRLFTGLPNASANLATVTSGIPAFFTPHLPAWLGSHVPLGVEAAAYYTTAPLRETLSGLIDLEHINARHIRLTVGAVNVRNGEMRYFDSRDEPVHLDHVIASGALPPAFPAVRIDGDPYWDGGIYSNTPIEAVLDDKPRQDSLIFAVQMWNPEGPDPET